MFEVSQIIKMKPAEAAAVHERAVAGDLGAMRTYCLYSAWKKIRSKKGYSFKAKREVMAAVASNHSFRVPLPGEDVSPPGLSLAPVPQDNAPSQRPWWGD